MSISQDSIQAGQDLKHLKSLEKSLLDLHDETMNHMKQFGGGAYPYQNYARLEKFVQTQQPKSILECGTALGLTSIAMALGYDQAKIVSVDKNLRCLLLAEKNAVRFGVKSRIEFKNSTFLEVVKDFEDEVFDLVFFDGFAPGYTIFLEMERVLKIGGYMICANLSLRGDRRKISLRMSDPSFYLNLESFDDTVSAQKQNSNKPQVNLLNLSSG